MSIELFVIFIVFINKIMIQKRINGHECQKPPRTTLSERQSEHLRFRYLSELSELSAVVQNPQAKNMGASEASLLDKMAAENDKMCNSSLFEDHKDKIFDTKMVEEMKFSFSNNDPAEIDHKSSHCSELLNKLHQEQSKSKGNLLSVNSESLDMRKRKQAIKEEIMNQSIETIKNKYIFNQRKNQRSTQQIDMKGKGQYKADKACQNQSIDNVFNKVLIEVKRAASRDEILPLSKQILPTIKQKAEQQPILTTKNSIQRIVDAVPENAIDHHYLEVLFQVLDRSKTGKIDKYNCYIEAVREEFQLIFGIIFYRIKYSSEGFTKREFVQLALECLRQLDLQAALALLRELDASWQSKSSKEQQKYRNRRSQSRYEEKGVSLYHLLDSPPKEKAPLARTDQQTSVSLTKRPYVDLKETRFENNKVEVKAESSEISNLAKQDKYAGKYIKNSELSNPSLEPVRYANQARYETTKAERTKVVQGSRFSFRDKENCSRKYMTNPSGQATTVQEQNTKVDVIPKKKRNISEEILQEHKKNLQELQKLNQKMQNYIYHRPQGQTPHSVNHKKQGQYNLRPELKD